MKNNFMVLLENDFVMMWNRMKYSKRKRKFLPLPLLVVGGAALILGSMIPTVIAQMGIYMADGTPEEIVYGYYSTTFMMAALLAITRGGMSNDSNDAGFLLSMPIKKSTIMLSKSVVRYAFDFALITIIFAPSVVVYYVMAAQPLAVLLRGILSLLLMPLFSVGVAYSISCLLIGVSKNFKRPEMLRTVLMVVSTVAFMAFYMTMPASVATGEGMRLFVSSFGPLVWAADFIVAGDIAAFGLYLLITALPFGIGVALQSRMFGRKAGTRKSTDTTLKFRRKSQLGALFGKEIRFYFSLPIYVTNTIMSPVMAVVGTVVLVSARDNVIAFAEEFFPQAGLLPFVVFMAMCFIISMGFITSSSISLEGKNIRVMRAAPLAENKVFWAKILLQIVVLFPVIFICIAVACISISMPLVDIILFEAAGAALSLLVAAWGLYVNLIFPKMQWDNEVSVVKQGMATMVAVFSNMAVSAVPAVIYFAVAAGSFAVTAAWSCGIFLVLTTVVCALLFSNGVKRYREL